MSNERTTINMVVGFLGLVVLFGMGIGGYLAVDGKAVPDFIIATTSAGVGALGSLLARTSTWSEPQSVIGPAGGPVPVEDVEGQRGASDVTLIVLGVLAVVVVLILVGRL